MLLDNLPVLLSGLLNTLSLCLLAALLSLVAGHAALFLRLSPWALARGLSRAYVSLMRGTPSLVQLFVLYFSMPLVGLPSQPLLAAVIALGLNSGAYVSEILRANLSVVSRGQTEAAMALGLSPVRTWRRIALPQVWRASLAGLVNEFTILLKTTPLASVVGVTELAFAGQMVSARTFQQEEVLMVVACSYLLITLPVVALARHLAAPRDGAGSARAVLATGGR
jgi:polar amino acid transport system permease protein